MINMNSKIKNEATDNLFRCILTMKNIEGAQLFEDLCTVHEIQAIAQRNAGCGNVGRKCIFIEIAEKRGLLQLQSAGVNKSPYLWNGRL